VGSTAAWGTLVPQAPQKIAVSYKGEPQLPQNFAMVSSLHKFVRCRARSTHNDGERFGGENRLGGLPALRPDFWPIVLADATVVNKNAD
jgi:hypothetical protein